MGVLREKQWARRVEAVHVPGEHTAKRPVARGPVGMAMECNVEPRLPLSECSIGQVHATDKIPVAALPCSMHQPDTVIYDEMTGEIAEELHLLSREVLLSPLDRFPTFPWKKTPVQRSPHSIVMISRYARHTMALHQIDALSRLSVEPHNIPEAHNPVDLLCPDMF